MIMLNAYGKMPGLIDPLLIFGTGLAVFCRLPDRQARTANPVKF